MVAVRTDQLRWDRSGERPISKPSIAQRASVFGIRRSTDTAEPIPKAFISRRAVSVETALRKCKNLWGLAPPRILPD